MDNFYIATATDGRELRKRFFVTDGIPTQDKSKLFAEKYTYESYAVEALDDVYRKLTELADKPSAAIVMGRPLIASGVRQSEYFESVTSGFWIIDLDGVPIEGTTEETIVRCLPFLHGHSYVFAYSQSAGIKDGLRVRVICRVNPMAFEEFVVYARHYNDLLVAYEGKKQQYIDSSIYEPAKLIFTARPEIIGANDPHPTRVFQVRGDDLPVKLATLPRLVPITIKGSKSTFKELPALTGTWGAGEGQGRNKHAFIGLTKLKSFMGDDFDDVEMREKLWKDMITNAGGLSEDLREYGRFARKNARHVKIALTEDRVVLAIPNDDNSIPLDQGETRLREIIKRTVESKDPIVVAVNVTMGAGKTREALRQLGAHSRFLSHLNPLGNFNIDYYTPTIKMAEEGVEAAKAFQLTGTVERGRGQVVDDEPMCIKHDAVKAIQGVVDDISSYMCFRKKGEEIEQCPHYYGCKWQKQHREVNQFDIRFRSHEYLRLPMRTEGHENFRPVDFVVIDEASFVDSLTDVQSMEIGDLIAPRHDLHGDVLKFATVLNDGLTLERLAAAGLDEASFTALIHAEEALKPVPNVSPSMDLDQTNEAVKGYEPGWHRFASVWRRMRDSVKDHHLNRIRVSKKWLTLRWKSPLAGLPLDDTGKPKVPVLILSGTMRREVIEQFLKLDEYHEIDVMPHDGCRITQSDLKGSKSESLYGTTEQRRKKYKETDSEEVAAAQVVRELVKDQAKDRVLITYKDLEEMLGHVPSAHFKAVEGLNAYEGKNLLVYGRPLPPPYDVEDLAAAIFQDDPERIREIKGGWYPSRAIARRGEGFAYGTYHPDPRVEAVRWMTCEGEMMQAIARARYVRHPVEILILDKTPLPLRIDRVVKRHRLHPEWEAFEKAGIVPLSHAAASRMWPTIFKHGRTAERELKDTKDRGPDAMVVKYRTGKTKWSKAVIERGIPKSQLGNWEISEDTPRERAQNLVALRRQEYRDLIATVGAEELVDILGMTIHDGDVEIEPSEWTTWLRPDFETEIEREPEFDEEDDYVDHLTPEENAWVSKVLQRS